MNRSATTTIEGEVMSIGFSHTIDSISWWIWVLVKYPALVLHYPGVLLLLLRVLFSA
jgi:hypothetical protein